MIAAGGVGGVIDPLNQTTFDGHGQLLSIENRLMADSDFFAEVRAFEDELIDSYLNGELSGLQEKGFESTS